MTRSWAIALNSSSVLFVLHHRILTSSKSSSPPVPESLASCRYARKGRCPGKTTVTVISNPRSVPTPACDEHRWRSRFLGPNLTPATLTMRVGAIAGFARRKSRTILRQRRGKPATLTSRPVKRQPKRSTVVACPRCMHTTNAAVSH